MPAFFLLTALTTLCGVALMVAMYARRDPYYGVLGLIALCVAGITGAAYGVLDSAA